MNITQIKYFIEIAKCQSISEASRNLFVTQPTLSLALKKLENDLNQQLIYRTENGLKLTQAGKILYEEGQVIVKQFDSLFKRLQNTNQNDSKQQIRIGMTTLFAIQFSREIALFTATYPHVELVINQDGSRKLQRLLAQKKIDIGLLSYPNYEPNQILSLIHI